MADSTLRMTFGEMYKRVAEYLGIAPRSGGITVAPTNTNDLDLVKRLTNDGYRRFLLDNEKWNFLNVPLTILFFGETSSTITAHSGTTITCSSLAGVHADDFFNGYSVRVITAAGTEIDLVVTDYTGLTGIFTFAAVAGIANGDTLYTAGARNVNGEGWRYYLPDDFYGLWKAPLTYGTTGPRIKIVEVTEEHIRELRAAALTSGDAYYVATRPINVDATANGNRWEALFWPNPTAGYTVTGIYKRMPNMLTASTDVSVAGFHHDNAVLAAALAAAELHKNDSIGIHEATYQLRLTTSKKLDGRSNPSTVGGYGDNSDAPVARRLPSDVRPTSYNGVDV